MTRIGAALGVILLLAGCSGPGPTSLESDNGRIIALASESTDAAEQALLEGTAGWSVPGCMVVQNGLSYLVVFPKGTTLSDELVVLPDGTRIKAGDVVGLGGGFHDVKDPAAEFPDVPEACFTDEVFFASGEVQ